ncbi:MAG: ABC transporter substrate-binding protein [Rhodopseudomonas sp.]|nr:ABC transporter substrate-binding protein [Rhodopseudomonas sp.]
MTRSFIHNERGAATLARTRRPKCLTLRLFRPGVLGLGLLLFAAAPSTAAQADNIAVNNGAAADTSRIVSIGGAVTEILYALGFENNIVGIDSTSLYPARAAHDKKNVGYMRQLSAEGVLGLRPSLIVAIAGSGPTETMTVLKAAHVPLVEIPESYTETGIVEKIRLIARTVGAGDKARCLIERVHSDIAALKILEAGIGRRKRVLFVLSFVNGRAMAAGRDTAADGIIKLAGGVNTIDDYGGYKPLSDEAIVAARPDVILSMQRGGPGVLTADAVFSHAAFSATPAAAHRSFVAMEGLYLLGFGPRTARAARDLAATLYPGLKTAPLPSEHASGTTACPE